VFGTRNKLVLGALGGVVAFSGCLLNLDSGPGFSILQSVVATGEALPETTRAAGGTAAATVSGRIVGKLPCDEVAGDVSEKSGTLYVTVTLRADRQVCNGVAPTTFSYIANLLNVPAGEQRIVVEHRYEGVDGVNGVRLDSVVVVG
jgi:hypothetical protein